MYADGRPPYPTSLDLYAELKAVTPPAQQELLADLVERSTYWDLRTKSARARKVGEAWEVSLEVEVGKVSVDRNGKETPRPLHELVEIGVYGPETEAGRGPPLYLRKHPLKPGLQRITVAVPGTPASGGIDPRNLLIDAKRDDNLAPVDLASGSSKW